MYFGDVVVAVCPNINEVHIYKVSASPDTAWERVYILEKHDQLVSGIGWAPKSNKIATCSHGRISYVWSLESDEWLATLVILCLYRAATSVQWGPQENKFAVGSGAKTVCVCYYEEGNNWWVSKLIRKKHLSSVTSVSWHPNNVLLTTTSTGRKCRIFSAFIKGVDARTDVATSFGDVKFGDTLSSWLSGVDSIGPCLWMGIWSTVVTKWEQLDLCWALFEHSFYHGCWANPTCSLFKLAPFTPARCRFCSYQKQDYLFVTRHLSPDKHGDSWSAVDHAHSRTTCFLDLDVLPRLRRAALVLHPGGRCYRQVSPTSRNRQRFVP